MANWSRYGEWLPIASLSASFDGPVVLADETQTVTWFSEKPSKAAVEHREHERDEHGHFVFDGEHEDGSQKPKMKTRKVKPAFWAMARITG